MKLVYLDTIELYRTLICLLSLKLAFYVYLECISRRLISTKTFIGMQYLAAKTKNFIKKIKRKFD